MLEIRLLGPWEVTADGRPVRLPGKLRTVLAVLAMSAGRTVPVDRIVDALWESRESPRNPRASVQTYVARLRGVLGAETIETDAVGYVLRVEPESVDALQFFTLLEEAGRAVDPAGERARLVEALRLWRGKPLEGLNSSWLHDTLGPRLVERYLAAIQRRIDLDLRGDEPAGLVAELHELTSRYPLREPLWVRLLQALQRSGRQAEALERYEAVRQRLAEELGADPSPELQAVHAELLSGSPAEPARTETAAAAPAPAPGRGVVPRQLPADIAGFTGRRKELSTLDRALGEGGAMAVVTIAGAAGVGKTSLAVHWAHAIAERFPDGQLYANLRGYDPSSVARPPGEVVRAFLEALRVAPHEIPSELEAQVALYRSVLSGLRVLVVLDNARNAEQVRPLLPGSSGCLVVVTSRDRLAGLVAVEGARPVMLDVLSMREAHDLLHHRLGARRVGRDPESTERIIRACAQLPLALAIAAARAALRPDLPLRMVAQQLAAGAGNLDPFAGDDPTVNVRAVFSWSYQTLSEGAARLFRLLGLHPGPGIGAAAVASLAGVPLPEVGPLLSELVSANMLTGHGPDRYWYHDLLRAYGAEQTQTLDTQADRRSASLRLLDHYLHTAYRAASQIDAKSNVIEPAAAQSGVTVTALPDRDAAMAWFQTEHACLLRVIEWAAAAGFDDHVCRLAGMLVGYQELRGHWHDAVDTQRAALAAAGRLGEVSRELDIRCPLSRAYSMLHRHDEARAELVRALEISHELGDLPGQALVHHHLVLMHHRLGQYLEGLEHGERLLALARQTGHRRLEAIALNNSGWFCVELGKLDQAAEYCRAALDVHREIGNRYGESSALDSLGLVYHKRGELGEAERWYEQALVLYRSLGDRYGAADTLVRLGDTYAEAGHTDQARSVWEESRRLFTLLGREAELSRLDVKLKGLESEAEPG